MRKDSALSFRIPRGLKSEIERIAQKEGRSVAQICEALLSAGLEVYDERGTKLLQLYFSKQRLKQSD